MIHVPCPDDGAEHHQLAYRLDDGAEYSRARDALVTAHKNKYHCARDALGTAHKNIIAGAYRLVTAHNITLALACEQRAQEAI